MATDKEIAIISHLRGNARKKLSEIGAALGMPASTMRARLQRCQQYIKKYTAIVDFEKLGFIKIKLVVGLKRKHEFKEYLRAHPNINSLCILNDADFLIELIFRTFSEFDNFLADIHAKFELTVLRIFLVSEEIIHERFMSLDDTGGMVGSVNNKTSM